MSELVKRSSFVKIFASSLISLRITLLCSIKKRLISVQSINTDVLGKISRCRSCLLKRKEKKMRLWKKKDREERREKDEEMAQIFLNSPVLRIERSWTSYRRLTTNDEWQTQQAKKEKIRIENGCKQHYCHLFSIEFMEEHLAFSWREWNNGYACSSQRRNFSLDEDWICRKREIRHRM